MNIIIITPAAVKSLSGNRATAARWGFFLKELGHKVSIDVTWDGKPYDLMIALHAWRSANSIQKWKQQYPDKSLIVAMTGTDLYQFIHTHSELTLHSIELADQLVVLHDLAYLALPESARDKVNIVYQSAHPLPFPIKRSKRTFDVCVVGHLRDEKDPLRAAYAVRDLPESSRIRIRHYGKAHNQEWAEMAQTEMKTNPRYHWFAEVKHWQIRQVYARCHLMVLSSNMEGGANVISEAAVAALPVIASEIEGSIGLLGEDYLGYFPVQDTEALSCLLLKAETDASFMDKLEQQAKSRAELFHSSVEASQLKALLHKLNVNEVFVSEVNQAS
ncbi:MAG: selenoneine biosynthesis selenosugar synthase SenB [Cocleimonas sp.]